MATEKKRINITVPRVVDVILQKAARRDGVPVATKAAELLRSALETDEDLRWEHAAKKRDSAGARFVPHADAWRV